MSTSFTASFPQVSPSLAFPGKDTTRQVRPRRRRALAETPTRSRKEQAERRPASAPDALHTWAAPLRSQPGMAPSPPTGACWASLAASRPPRAPGGKETCGFLSLVDGVVAGAPGPHRRRGNLSRLMRGLPWQNTLPAAELSTRRQSLSPRAARTCWCRQWPGATRRHDLYPSARQALQEGRPRAAS